jgi:predicted Rossmann fold nucleotide-binding protein DprA/Smf involved in DNA uptake
MASGIDNLRDAWQFAEHDSVCLVSQFFPSEPWSGPRAMQRNSTIAALSDRVFIAAARDSGGSWEMGRLCLKEEKRLFVLDRQDEGSSGTQKLIAAGATPVSEDNLDLIFETQLLTKDQDSLF